MRSACVAKQVVALLMESDDLKLCRAKHFSSHFAKLTHGLDHAYSCPMKQKLKLVVTASPRIIVHNQHIVEWMLHLSVAVVEVFC